MTQEVFEKIKAGLEEAIEYAKEDQSGTGETAFTPGPWRCTKKHPRQICDWRGFKIAKCLMETKGANFKISEDEALANAHLTAAAPDLFGALAAIIEAHDSYLEDVPLAVENPDPLTDAIEASRPILAKARGEAQ